jgi:hypothetical protein
VRDLLRRHGDTAVAGILARIARGAAFDDAFGSVTGGSPGEFAGGYFRREAMWTTWVPFLTSTTVLWMGITLLALLAIRRRRDRDAAQREAWALEEHPVRSGSGAADVKNGGGEDDGGADDPRRWN